MQGFWILFIYLKPIICFVICIFDLYKIYFFFDIYHFFLLILGLI
jgi:hypothetical protein